MNKRPSQYYKTIIFDLDGVLFDSNRTKSDNILKAAGEFTDPETAEAFVAYFTGLNGVPREVKIKHYFKDTPETGSAILKRYNALNEDSIYQVAETPGMRTFLAYCSERYELLLLSGGAGREIRKLLETRKLTGYFRHIMGGPAGKTENLNNIAIDPPVLYIGDSKVDFETAQKFHFDFVFMYGYTQFTEWPAFFSNHKNCLLVETLEELHKTFLPAENTLKHL